MTSSNGRVLRANKALRVLLGEPDSLPESDWEPTDVGHVASALADATLLRDLVSLEGPVAHRCSLTAIDGTSVEVEWYSYPVHDVNGAVSHVDSIGQVVPAGPSPEPTGRPECSCARLVQLLRLLDQVSDHVFVADDEGVIEYVNPAFEAVSGRPREWVLGRRMREVWRDPLDPAVESQIAATLRAGGSYHGERVNRNARGELFFNELTLSTVQDPLDRTRHIIGVGRDTTFRHLSDPLTGLQSRHVLLEQIAAAIADLQRDPANRKFALLFVDVDHFKAVNDTYGKEMGDQVILELSRRLQHAIPEVGAAGRVSHINRDEFAVLLDRAIDGDDACRIAGRVLKRIREPFLVGNTELIISASIGIARSSAADYVEPEDVLRDAETAMTWAKRAGGNSFEIFAPALQADVVERMLLGAELRRALDRRELWLGYQPIVSLATGEITGAEALVRWRHPTRGLVPPNDFIGAAEQNGLIVAIGDYVLREACGQMTSWRDLGFGSVAVNVSTRQLRHPEFVASVAEALEQSGLPGSSLKLEVTESTAAHDPVAVTELLRRVKALGVEILMDDFGTGYSSLNYLTRLPLDRLKIDRSFVERVPGSDHDASVAMTIVAMAHSLGLGVVAEGVETRDQLAFLCELGCEEMQGYLFSPPLEATAFEALMRSGRRLDVPEVAPRSITPHPGC